MFNDCRGNTHNTNEERHGTDVEIVTEVLMGVSKWVHKYTTENGDYPDGYDYIIDEMSHDWAKKAKDYVLSAFEDCNNYDEFAESSDKIVEDVCGSLQGSFHCEPEYTSSDYACYSGPGLCLYQFDIGEYEEQVDISQFDELQTLHDAGILDDILDDVNCDCYVSRQCRREKNEKTGKYENVGRETYRPYKHNDKYPCLITYHMPGGQWMWVVPKECIDDLIQEAIEGFVT